MTKDEITKEVEDIEKKVNSLLKSGLSNKDFKKEVDKLNKRLKQLNKIIP